MTDTSALLEALHGIGERIDDGMSEKDVENAFLNEDFYEILGYSGAGHDLRSEWTLPDNRRPDYVTLDANESVTAIYEFKTSGKQLGMEQEDQLFHYVDELKADYGVLTNGEEIRLYSREGHDEMLTVHLSEATSSHAADLSAALSKPEWDITAPSSVHEYLDGLDAVELSGELGREHFFETFRLEEDSPFADLVTSMVDLLQELRDEEEAKFVKGAYDFWEASYASEPDEIPDSWDGLIDGGKQELRDFMFALESGHALLARLLLAKASLDHEFFPDDRGLERYFRELGGFSGTISLDAYPVAANGMIDDMRNQLVESLFEDDIFIWWTDGYAEETASLHKNPYNRFRDVAKEGTDVTRVSPATRERFSRAVAHVIFSVLKFDFSAVEGDPLGDLYQRYFDPETRKALGEFYTPQEVVDYIMDGVGYDMGIHDERLIDPSCGSGTFLVEAVERYIEDVERYNDDPDWEEHLTKLCTRPHIVGLDIHPFAVLMAQIRFMVAILPKYKEAKQSNGDFTIRRLPIFRTDSLRNERELSGVDLGDDGTAQLTFDSMTEDSQDVRIPVPLPVEVDEDEVDESEYEDGFLVQRVRMPLFDNIRLNTGVRNFGEYYAALQGVLDVAKWYLHEGEWEYNGGLKQGIERYTTREYDGIEEFFEPYLQEILETVRYLRLEHGDGRLFKIFEDTVLSLVVKNYMDYGYVVGNPPYVRIQHLPDRQKSMLSQLYESTTGNYDLYCPFYERGLDWLKEGTGKLGYITPNQFMVTDYGEGIRRVLRRDSRLDEVYDFRDSGVFEDATNYPAIIIAEDEPDEDSRDENEIRCVRVKANVDDDSGRALDEAIIAGVRDHRGEPGYSDDYIDVFDFPQSELGDGYWSMMPPEELEVFRKLEQNSDHIVDEVTDDVSHGTQTSANTVYVVDVLDAGRIESDDQGDVVTIVPSGESKEYKIETDLLRPWLSGRDVERWRAKWSGQHVVLPYCIEQDDEGELTAELYSEGMMKEQFPHAWNFFKSHEEKLRGRESGRWENSDEWWEFGRPQNLEKFEIPKIIFAHLSQHASFMLDEVGTWYYKTAYSVLLSERYLRLTEEIACELNSNALDFYFKHITTVKAGGYYEYRSQYVEKLPCITAERDGEFDTLREKAGEITDTIDLESRTERFPEAYLGDFDGELAYIDYEWQTRRYPVNANIQELADGRFAVQAGRSDEITAPQMDKGDRDDRKLRAKYVHAAVDGRKMKKGEEQTIPIPKRTEDVEQLIEALEADRQTVEETSIEDLEAEIDDVVYDLFDLTDNERQVIEEYLEVF
ncbi:Eco57I restriction-modification methylase domain-containing protein [Haloferax larsenii]|uniref:site-specific DNA-methyltransferase (adenine-specific) n=1 Tax=Haloferax larsenii TaxID=302484 RepID=A0A1H7RPN9_HALLR|nr:TaqI-like C-terminal specificity domain-containing protein [Haloferax larsenii]SEL61347.1 Type I restriction enzyme R protein N terminus (HSDR_N) [Haloferax larsenii]